MNILTPLALKKVDVVISRGGEMTREVWVTHV